MVLIFGLILSVLVYRYCIIQLRDEAQSRFEHETREIHRRIADRFSGYSGLLWGLRGFFHAAPDASRSRFSAYVRGLDLASRNPAVVSLNFAEHVTASRLEAFERRVRADRSMLSRGYPEFRVNPAGVRDDYQVLLYLEPFEPAGHAFGLDLGDMPSGRFEEVIQSGQLVSSGEVLARNPGLPLAMRLAVYRRGMPLESAIQRKAAYAGSVGLEFSLLRLMQEAVPPDALSKMRIRLYNIGRNGDAEGGRADSQGSLLIDSSNFQGRNHEAAGLRPDLVCLERLEFGGAMLEIRFEGALESFAPEQIRVVPQIVLVAGLGLSLLLAAVVELLLRSRTGLATAVDDRSRELRLKNAALDREIRERDRVEREVMQGLTGERRHYGQELHDNLGQQLTAAGFLIEVLRSELEREGRPAQAARAADLATRISGAISRTRDLSHRLSPVEAVGGALTHALHGLAADTRARYGVACQFQSARNEDDDDLANRNSLLEHHLFRMAQHAVAHALERGSSRIRITLEKAPLAVTIAGNGSLAEHDHDESLRIMAFRSRALGLAFGTSPALQDGTDGVTLRFEERMAG